MSLQNSVCDFVRSHSGTHIDTSTIGCWRWWFRRPACSSHGSTSSWNCYLFLI